MFSRRSGKKKKPDGPAAEPERVFSSVHLTADRAGPVLYVTITDENITEREAGIIFEETGALIDDRCTAVIVDFSEVTMLASAGIGTIVRLHKRMNERKGSLIVCSLSDDLVELFKLTRMDRLFAVAADRDAALAAAQG